MILLVFFMYFMFALTFIFGSASINYAEPIFLIGLRMIITAALIFLYLFTRRSRQKVARRDWWVFGLLGIIHIFIPYVGENIVYKYLPAAQIALMWNLSPLITAGFSLIMLHERITLLKLVGLLIGFVGFVPMLVHEYAHETGLRSFFYLSYADWLLILAVVSAAAAWSLVRVLRHRGYGALIINGWSMLIGGLLSFLTSFGLESWHPVPVYSWPMTCWYIGLLVLTGGILGYNLYGHLLHQYTATFLSFAGCITPVFTAVLAYIFLGDAIDPVLLISTAITAIGVYLVYQQDLQRGYIHD